MAKLSIDHVGIANRTVMPKAGKTVRRTHKWDWDWRLAKQARSTPAVSIDVTTYMKEKQHEQTLS